MAISFLLSAFQIRALSKKAAVTTSLPSPLNAALTTSTSWPFKTPISVPLSASQMRAVLLEDPVTTRLPSAVTTCLPSPLNAALFTELVWPFSDPCFCCIEVVSAQKQRFTAPACVPAPRELPKPGVLANPIKVHPQCLGELRQRPRKSRLAVEAHECSRLSFSGM